MQLVPQTKLTAMTADTNTKRHFQTHKTTQNEAYRTFNKYIILQNLHQIENSLYYF